MQMNPQPLLPIKCSRLPFQIKPLYKHTFEVLHCTIYFSVPKSADKTSDSSIKAPLPKSSNKDDDDSHESDKQNATPLPKSSNKDDDDSRESDKQKTIPSLENNDDDDSGDEPNKQDTLLSSKTSKQVIIKTSQ